MVHMLLNSMADQDTYNDVSDEAFKEQLAKTLGACALRVLHALLAREIIDYEVALPKGRTETHRGLLTDIELAACAQN